jgi:hypothetical protein
MRFGRRGAHWYDFVIGAIALAIVYPDVVLGWLSERTGKAYGWLHLMGFEIIAVAVMTGTMMALMPHYPKLTWWQPLLFVGMVTAFRFLMWVVVKIFGFDD